jgi:hypothetical protein
MDRLHCGYALFPESSKMEAAYGFFYTIAMLMTTTLMFYYLKYVKMGCDNCYDYFDRFPDCRVSSSLLTWQKLKTLDVPDF